MTEPSEPTPGAPADTAPPAQPPPTPFDPASLTPEAQAYLKAQIDAADLKARTGSKANAAAEARREMAAQVAKALGLAGDEPPSPDELADQLAQARDAQWATGLELQMYRVAPELAERLLDSRSFVDSLDDLVDLDPRSAEFRTALAAKVQEAAAKHTTAPAPGAPGPRPDPSQGARGAAPTGRPTSLTSALTAHYAAKR